MEKLYLKANIKLHEETEARKKEAASVIALPKDGEKQIDLQYFSAVFVSSGANLNHAYFLPSELIKAEHTIVNKAMDIEHKESEIVGHIYDRAFMDKDGNRLEIEELASMETANLDDKEMHIVIAGIVYKNRFPDLAREVADGKWSVSMETYFGDFDVKIGDLIISRKEAEVLGLASDDINIFGRLAKVIKNKIEIAAGKIDRVLRGISFSGCGFVKNPANPPSIVLETATDKGNRTDVNAKPIILNYDLLEQDNNNVTSNNTEASNSKNEEEAELVYNDSPGICVSYKKEVLDSSVKDELSKVIHTDWCALYERGCTSFSRDTTDPECLRNQVRYIVTSCVEDYVKEKASKDRRKELLDNLKKLI